ncbi:MAG: orotidine-5'-phosphate decarboxylase [Candidatus Melainabacteria bacterium]|nr:orotidine-5'-phosphate decarboxylase [Candidatus Melainabacteria bacterium]
MEGEQMLAQGNKLNVKDRLIVALDVSSIDEAKEIVKDLREHVGMFKMGLELFASAGLSLFEMMREEGINVFFDGKFHDIPNTAAQASRNITRQGVAMFNVHATGGGAMMKAAADACKETAATNKDGKRPLLIAVTVLTSISPDVLKDELQVGEEVMAYVTRLALLSKNSGLDGVVASAKEAASIRKACGDDFLIVTPGIRPQWAATNDQKRIVTPSQAIKDGADYLVIGRPITAAKDRKDAAQKILEEMETAV